MQRKLPIASPEQAKFVWAHQRRPSARNVARAMTAAGYPDVARWKAQGRQHTINDVHPLDLAGGKLESIAPLATGNPSAVIGEGAGDKSSNISQNARTCQMQSFSRELCISSIEVKSALEQHLNKLVRKKPGELALLYEALAQCSQPILGATLQAERIERAPPLPRSP